MIVVPVFSDKIGEALGLAGEASKIADALELRLDYFEELSERDVEKLVKAAKKPVICTCRSQMEGGRFRGSEQKIAATLKTCAKAGADFVDVEYGLGQKTRRGITAYAKNVGAKIILSKHFTRGTPKHKDLLAAFTKMSRENPFAVKIVSKANRHEDNLRMLALHSVAARKKVRLIAFCMGRLGRESRVLSILAGGFATFASLRKGLESADGQLSVFELRKIFNSIGVVF